MNIFFIMANMYDDAVFPKCKLLQIYELSTTDV